MKKTGRPLDTRPLAPPARLAILGGWKVRPMRPSSRPFARAAIAAFAVSVVGAALPIWTAYFAGPLEVTGEYTGLWTAVARLPDCRHVPNESVWEAQWTNAVAGIVLVLAGGGVGRVMFRASH